MSDKENRNISDDTQEFHNHEAQCSLCIRKKRNEEQIMSKKKPHINHRNKRRIATAEPTLVGFLNSCIVQKKKKKNNNRVSQFLYRAKKKKQNNNNNNNNNNVTLQRYTAVFLIPLNMHV